MPIQAHVTYRIWIVQENALPEVTGFGFGIQRQTYNGDMSRHGTSPERLPNWRDDQVVLDLSERPNSLD
jgi:hypothetical protein